MSGFNKKKFNTDNFKKILKKTGMSHSDLAKEVGRTPEEIQKYESGVVNPWKTTIEKIAKALDVEPVFLYVDIEEMEENTYKDVSESVSGYIWDLLKDANEFGLSIREETITETSLLHIKKMIPKNFFVQQISTQIENKIGADWEWFVIKEDKWLGFRVQAKRLSVTDDNAKYKTLHYTPGVKDKEKPVEKKVKKNQCQNLILSSWKEERIPLYCFYNYLPNNLIKKLFAPNIQTIKAPSIVKESIKVDSSGLGWLFCYADHLFPTKNYDGNNNFKQVLEFNENFQLMFSRDLEEIANEYNSINPSDDEDGGDGDGGGGGNNGPEDSPTPTGGIDIIDKYIDKDDMPEEEFERVQKSIKIKVKRIDELPLYAKNYLGQQEVLKFAEYDEDEKENLEIPSCIVYSVLEKMPFTSMNENEDSIENEPEVINRETPTNEQVRPVRPQKNDEKHGRTSPLGDTLEGVIEALGGIKKVKRGIKEMLNKRVR
ncbi:helix-turn-helix transcriptional regulator [Priestia aryabhattai]|uniref:helix-turn-helix domain-containing protein n=1 Tax=Priestia TaxID=2800373 RepID=UPI00234F6C3F|nr:MULTISPECIES: helix-turn-helix transcriptional regulator [Priestia]MDC7762665.1 helix-turn-helix transcriptional regulator [Priestia aryabhattai]MED3980879.1 helix-turn-helix transcriptional regulator [Priestia megaterium]